ncbi:DUF2187 domain-containing protein [Tuanshanicoccus lijuaniae]|uniref:DUF2187 domain-containing protein n=1 Tax=Aerococcaceae bacterium zg-1292 TaxID=2774330 RepID=UPI0019359C78|nr:DUF2187 domain-containing protein [Aerococcaceae bacterium zg-1292]MBF6625818.1 DUF2187 domain-containing protein [Aerococcaceae bacterium zg-BR9]MBF6978621.1 DUF2187 domain-containing protein [Aerococcaceae bacterium zg-BR22]MBS4455606.1 DUF2187 domain-containing protein [Aerococcaceae bacterium zg-A91]MBS4457225.1 DUF2187 domain-containing protein [Aerococcaceae bacterium zg-BR33]
MAAMLMKQTKSIIERELRRGTSKSRIAAILNVEFEEAQAMIESVKKSIRPDLNDVITFNFRDNFMTGTIIKLLTNSAVVKIDWSKSDTIMKDICEERTIVNFKDIIDFVSSEDE